MTVWSYFDDFNEEEREQLLQRRIREGQTAKEILKRFGHPSTWEAEQLTLFGGRIDDSK